jgi:CTLH/CRA C-terminal to LisH motif domain
MVRVGQQLPAIAYYRKHLVPFATTHRDEIHRAAALLAFPHDTEVQPYKVSIYNSLDTNGARICMLQKVGKT